MGLIHRTLRKIYEKKTDTPSNLPKEGIWRIRTHYADNSGEIMGHYLPLNFTEEQKRKIGDSIKEDLEGVIKKEVELLELSHENIDIILKEKYLHITKGNISDKIKEKYKTEVGKRAAGTGKITMFEIVSRKDNEEPYLLSIGNGTLETPIIGTLELQSSKYYKLLLEKNTGNFYVITATSLGNEFRFTPTDRIYPLQSTTVKTQETIKGDIPNIEKIS